MNAEFYEGYCCILPEKEDKGDFTFLKDCVLSQMMDG